LLIASNYNLAMTKQPAFIQKQYEFSANIRDPERNTAPADVDDTRMAVYRELFFNNVEDFMSSSFPVLRELTTDDRWTAMIRDYFSRHLSHTPYFHQMPAEFVDYLQNEREAQPDDPPFMLELAHYEWMELVLSLSDEEPDWQVIDQNGDVFTGVPVVSPLAIPLSYQFPVHEISKNNQPTQAGELSTHIVVYRNKEDEVHFLEINTATLRLLQLFSEDETLTGKAALELVAKEMNHPDPKVVIDGGKTILADLLDRQVLLGTKRS